ncbi:hypothetical protein [uncultured Microbulbifer sp.]|uniref:hypothetical protein n=1 Tax=uncultured Microbulbifer sp. TaxID=348147 RepID=UPI00261D591C|nr:hypothetical protein [uncultured Microbulbifer sp.]
MYQAFSEMPTLLKFLTAHALVCIYLLLAVFVPGIPISFNGVAMGTAELWESGLAISTALVGLLMPVSAVLFLWRWKYSRQTYSVLLAAVMIIPFALMRQVPSIIFGACLTAVILGYLFFNSGVRAYFRS